MSGRAYRLTHRGSTPPRSDQVLLDKVRSEVLGRHPRIAHQMNIDAADGVITLRGEIDDIAEADALLAALRGVAGVEDVISLLHGPGQAAPNKAPARRVSI